LVFPAKPFFISGKEKSSQGRWTDILKKEGDKWLLIGDHGGPTEDED